MTSDRDALADLLAGLLVAQQQNQSWFPSPGGGEALCLDGWFDPKALAAAVLDAGLRPPAQVIETIEEIEALPGGAILADRDGDSWQLLPRGWRCPALDNEWMDRSDDWFTAADALHQGPLTVLYLPTENGEAK
jgi:hypothetical protein